MEVEEYDQEPKIAPPAEDVAAKAATAKAAWAMPTAPPAVPPAPAPKQKASKLAAAVKPVGAPAVKHTPMQIDAAQGVSPKEIA